MQPNGTGQTDKDGDVAITNYSREVKNWHVTEHSNDLTHFVNARRVNIRRIHRSLIYLQPVLSRQVLSFLVLSHNMHLVINTVMFSIKVSPIYIITFASLHGRLGRRIQGPTDPNPTKTINTNIVPETQPSTHKR